MKHIWLGFAVFFLSLGVIGLILLPKTPRSTPQQPPLQPAPKPETLRILWEGDVDPKEPWTRVGVSVKTGDRLYVRASGQVHWADDASPGQSDVGPVGSSGLARYVSGKPYEFPYQEIGCGALLLRINKRLHAVGSESIVVAREAGVVEFAVNDRPTGLYDNRGSFHVTISSVPSKAGIPTAPSETREEVAAIVAEQKANERNETTDCDLEKLPREEFGVERWRYTLKKVGHWCTKGIRVTGDQEVKVQGPDYQDFQVLYYGKVYTARTGWRSIFFPDRGTDIVYFSATTPMTITVTVSK